MNTAVMFSTGKDDWQTPLELFQSLDKEFLFSLDVAADTRNALTHAYFTAEDDALGIDWSMRGYCAPPVCWCNPPYSRGKQAAFILKASIERRKGVTTVMLLPARTDTKAFHACIWDAEKHQPREGVEVRFLPGRLKFVGAKDGAPFPSMIVVFRGAAA